MAWRFRRKEMPSGLWMRCPKCETMLYRSKVAESLETCPDCGEHFRIDAPRRIEITADEGTFEEFGQDVMPRDALNFMDKEVPYSAKLVREQEKTGDTEAVKIGRAKIHGIPVMLGVMNFKFLGGSMGLVVGEKITMAVETAEAEDLPLIIFAASGGARMHEGILSLMQMAKTSAAIARFKQGTKPYISVLTHPTTGGVTASFAALGDLAFAEPDALIGFAGPRVIQTTLKADLPEGFQRAEFLLEKGFIDRIVPRLKMRDELAMALEYCGAGERVREVV